MAGDSRRCWCGKLFAYIGPEGAECPKGHVSPRGDDGQLVRVSAPSVASPGAEAEALAPRYGLVTLADVEAEIVRWLWRDRIPLGKLSILDGDPGLGKSALTLDLAARVSRGGLMPDGTASEVEGPAGVILLSAEDGPGDTIRPRLEVAGADLARIAVMTHVVDVEIQRRGDEEIEVTNRRLPTLGDHRELHEAVQRMEARLVVIDPLMAYLDARVNAHVDQDVRAALAPVAQLAERTGAAILVVRHLSKMPGGNPLYRGGGSIGIIGAARSGLVVAPDPDDATGQRRILASTKSNLSALAPALAYHLEPTSDSAVRIAWEGVTEHTAAALLAVPTTHADQPACDEAIAFLQDVLADGPRLSREVEREAREAGISVKTLRRAREQLGIRPKREGFGPEGRWLWALPGVGVPIPAIDASPQYVGSKGRNGDGMGINEEPDGLAGAPDRIDAHPPLIDAFVAHVQKVGANDKNGKEPKSG